MTEEKYWQLFERAYEGEQGPDRPEPFDKLVCFLEEFSLADLIDYTKIFSAKREELLTPRHLSAAYLLYEGALGLDDFLGFTEAIVGAPKSAFTAVALDADAILDFPVYQLLLNLDGYPFAVAAICAGERKFGSRWRREADLELDSKPLTYFDIHLGEKRGLEMLNPELCRQLTPRLFERYAAACNWSYYR